MPAYGAPERAQLEHTRNAAAARHRCQWLAVKDLPAPHPAPKAIDLTCCTCRWLSATVVGAVYLGNYRIRSVILHNSRPKFLVKVRSRTASEAPVTANSAGCMPEP